MKNLLENLEIKNLFGYKPINITFNEDVTFIIGRNGSGKTTVLNILSSLISGNINFLTKYKMDKLVLTYKKRKSKTFKLSLERTDFDHFTLSWKEHNIIINLEKLRMKIRNKSFREDGLIYYQDEKDAKDMYFILDLIAKEFKNLYLPLSRDTRSDLYSSSNDKFKKDEMLDSIYVSFSDNKPTANIDKSLLYVHNLVKEKQRKIMLRYDELNKKMQEEMFQEAFVFDESKKLIDNNIDNVYSLIKSQNDLKEAFSEIDMLSKDFLVNNIDNFFTKLEKLHKNYVDWYDDRRTQEGYLLTDDIVMFIKNSSQIQRIQNWTQIVLKRNKAKTKIGKSMDNFFQTVNSYLNDSGKKINFNDKEGILEFSTKHEKNLPIESLSSGEKQIIIFFAYLILGISEKREGIFIVDEPELSLHLKWQQRFSQDIIKVSPQLQLIFATHSPEIVGSLRDKIFVLGGDHA